MRIPKEFLIKGKHWRVEYKWNLRHPDDNTALDGLCLFKERVIQLRRELTKDEKPLVFLHEVFHAILFEAHVSNNTGGVDGLLEEVICDSIADFIYSNFKLRWKRK